MRTVPQIMPATIDDLARVISILEDASAWLRDRGLDQWPTRFAPDPIAQAIKRGEVFMALVEGQVAGTLTLQWADPTVWRGVPDDAGYVHRLAIRREFGGRGLGYAMLHWAGQTVVEAGRRFLRLDCWAENRALCRYYENVGFTPRGKVEGPGWSAALYEKDLAPTMGTAHEDHR